MTIFSLLMAVKQRMEEIFKNYSTPDGKPIQVFLQSAPPKANEDDASSFPRCLVKLGGGQDGAEESTQEIVIELGAKDDSEDFSGYQTLCSVMEKIRINLGEFPTLNHKYALKKPMKWVLLPEDDTYPFYWGGMVLTFEIPPIKPGYNSCT